MNILLFGATGMVGQGVLRECLKAADVEQVRCVGRTSVGVVHPKLVETIRPDMTDLGAVEPELHPYDACFFCLGVSSLGMKEPQYTRLTYDLTLSVAQRLAPLNPQMTFVYVSGAGTDSTEKGSSMWARVKGRTENALLRLPFKAVALFRPGVIAPMHGVRSKTLTYRLLYDVFTWVMLLMRRLMPNRISTTETVGLAMLTVARHGVARPFVEIADIEALALRR